MNTMQSQQDDKVITIVSGLPRSGTSMMMKMLAVGGMDIVTDNIREADNDNPNGYYEYEQAKKIKNDISWLPATFGKAFKLVSMLLTNLPDQFSYKIIFMQRNLQEVITSQNKMLCRHAKQAVVDTTNLKSLYEKHLQQMQNYLTAKQNIEVKYIFFADCIKIPEKTAHQVCRFLDCGLDYMSMAMAVDPKLYRNKLTGRLG